MKRTFVWTGIAAALLLAQVGCRCCHHDPQPQPYPRPPYNPTAPLVPAPLPSRGPEVIQPEPLGPGGMPLLPAPGSGVPSRFGAPTTDVGPPVPTQRDLLPPTNVPLNSNYYAQPRVIDQGEPPIAPLNPFGKTDKPASPMPNDSHFIPPQLLDLNPTAKAPPANDSPASPEFPVGIASFRDVLGSDVSTGIKPADTDGLDWLQTHKYKTVVNLRRPGTPHTADKDQIEQRKMKYLSLEVSAETLTDSLVAEFCRAVAERSGRPLFVYDKDGTLAGAMWYAYFRTVEKLPPADAKKRATELGLKAVETGEHAALWKAAQKVSQD